jgi:hypothetical protein
MMIRFFIQADASAVAADPAAIITAQLARIAVFAVVLAGPTLCRVGHIDFPF